jgi:DNA-binding CsgD family transcriptional regulator
LGDPHLTFDVARINVRLALATSEAADWVSKAPSQSAATHPVDAWADYCAISALAHACVGDPDLALALSKEARGVCGYPSVVGACLLANAIAEGKLDPQPGSSKLAAAILECARIESLEPVVVAYRAHPGLLRVAQEDATAAKILSGLLERSHDRRLAVSAGLYSHLTPRKAESILTRREEEVIRLLAQGRSTREIAATLVIAPSTAKVHIHHILRKFNATSRLQAVLSWQRTQELETDG